MPDLTVPDLTSTSPHVTQPVERKMTIDQFVSNNRGINDSKDLPRPFLERLYNTIQQNEIKMSDEEIMLRYTISPDLLPP